MSSLAVNQVSNLFKNIENQRQKIINNKNNTPLININNNTSLMLCYYNIGVQQEFLKRENDSAVSYKHCETFANFDSVKNTNEGKQILLKLKSVKLK